MSDSESAVSTMRDACDGTCETPLALRRIVRPDIVGNCWKAVLIESIAAPSLCTTYSHLAQIVSLTLDYLLLWRSSRLYFIVFPISNFRSGSRSLLQTSTEAPTVQRQPEPAYLRTRRT